VTASGDAALPRAAAPAEHARVSPRYRNLALAVIALGIVAWGAARLGLLEPAPPPLVPSPEAVDRGRRVFERQCLHCHRDIPLERRVAGWSAERAWDAVGRLPQVYPSMPPFRGTPEERRDLALFLAALGAR
jgi:mono/diheme cytochrome c family protein